MKNPFIKRVDSFRKGSRRMVIPNDSGIAEAYTSDGELIDHVTGFEIAPYTCDRKRFSKIYRDGWIALMDLSYPALKVMIYLITKMGYSDVVLFEMQACMEFTGYKCRENVCRAMSELREKGFIARHDEKGKYYINPMYVYKGNRMKLLK